MAGRKNMEAIRRRNDLIREYGKAKEKEESIPSFDQNFLKNIGSQKSGTQVNSWDKDYLTDFINRYDITSGEPFDDPAVMENYMTGKFKLIMGLIEVRRYMYLKCIMDIKNLTIDEFTKYIVGVSRKNGHSAFSGVVDVLDEFMQNGLLKNHRLSPDKEASNRTKYNQHYQKVLEMTDDGRALISKIDLILTNFDKALLDDMVIRRSMFVERMRREMKEEKKNEEPFRGFSEETVSVVNKMKKLLNQ